MHNNYILFYKFPNCKYFENLSSLNNNKYLLGCIFLFENIFWNNVCNKFQLKHIKKIVSHLFNVT